MDGLERLPKRPNTGPNCLQSNAYRQKTVQSSPISPISPGESLDACFSPPTGNTLAPAAPQGISLRPSTTLAPSITASNALQPMSAGPSTGPMTSSIAVPARPKPGRKAATDEPDNKRKAQNRAAQRAFRERKTNVQKDLELQNNALRVTNDQLLAELTSLRAQAEHDRNRLTELENELVGVKGRECDYKANWENTLNQMTILQQKRQAADNRADSLTRQHQDVVQQLTMELNTYKTRLNQANDVTKSKNHRRPQEPLHVINTTPQFLPQKRPLDSGCCDPQPNGTCRCVDELLQDPEDIPRDVKPPLNRNMSTASMSITNLLSPPDSSRNNSHSEAPDLTSDQGSSPEEMEIDFTNQWAKMQPDTHIQTSDGCGLCGDGFGCVCRDNEVASLQPIKPMPPPAKMKPGTCDQCQRNPEQKAYCESLALQTKAQRETEDHSEGQPDPKRSRTVDKDMTFECHEAFAFYKEVSSKPGRQASFEDVYRTFMTSHPSSRRGTEDFTNDTDIKPRQFSAYETNIAAVLTTLGKDFRKNSSTK
ncbi:sequence-specific DNA binding [Venturia nashicola]|uniref:Sequence-specific DNA binding n=1 Tax=Venturia nashicola TaxID=86259 RepID=A0A4Z1PHT2_9PEZI|nr:sequence-specific DNA binding [Venturia nashicola]TLD35578.1 sequence-specific DNA binding [Venturia nashicola]